MRASSAAFTSRNLWDRGGYAIFPRNEDRTAVIRRWQTETADESSTCCAPISLSLSRGGISSPPSCRRPSALRPGDGPTEGRRE